MKKILMLATVAAILASTSVQSVLACTTRTPGYWKNHRDDWPASGTVTIGTFDYDLSEYPSRDLMAILRDQPQGDAWIILAQKVIAAQLSMLRYPSGFWDEKGYFGNYDGGMEGMVEDANILLAAAGSYPPGSQGREDVTDLADLIDYWLNYWNEHGL